MKKTITRREFLKKSMTGAGLAIAVMATPSGFKILSAEEVRKEPPSFSPSVWLHITPDNLVTIVVNKSEMGQGVYTSLPMVLADELDADWKQVRLKVAPADKKYNDPAWGRQLTGGSTSIKHMCQPLRIAGAAAREMLMKAAAEAWSVAEDRCEVRKGVVEYAAGKKQLSFGKLVSRASRLPVPQSPSLKKESMFTFIGMPMARLDIPDKTNGRAKYGIDTFVPNMLYAVLSRPPSYGAKPLSFDKDAAIKIRGVHSVVAIPRGVAVCADTVDAAWKGRDALNVRWDKGVDPNLSNETLDKAFTADLAKKGLIGKSSGDFQKAFEKAATRHEMIFDLPYLYHATMEPMNCTASVRKDRCEIWVPTQFQTAVLGLTEKETGLKPEQISVHTTYLGGGFGRRSEVDVVEEAVQISKVIGKPVKVLWKREEDVKNGFYRPGTSTKAAGGLDEKGRLVAWFHRIVCPSIFSRAMPAAMKNNIDPAAMDCLSDLEYEVPNLEVEYVRIDTPVPVGFWRSVGASHNGFTIESFVDEMAHLAKKDPLEFRLGLLKGRKRASRVLETVAEKAGWSKPVRKGEGRGISWVLAFGTYVAQVAEVSVDKKSGSIRVHRVVCAVDCGPVVNPAILTAQMRGGIIMGLSAALKERMNFSKGGVESSNFDDYPLIRMNEVPEIEVHIIKSTDAQSGAGEPGLPPIAPAVANAVFNATGIRIRNLPMLPDRVKEAMGKA